MINYITFFISFIFLVLGSFILICSFVGFLRYDDFFIKMHSIKLSNIYGLNSIMLFFAINSKNILIFIHFLIFIILNILLTLIVSHIVSRIALIKNISHSAITRKEYEKKYKKNEE